MKFRLFIRCAARLGFFIPWTLSVFALRYALKGLVLVSPRGERRARKAIFQRWAKVVCTVLGIRVEVKGNHPQGGFFQVSNHLSFLDIIVLARELGCIFVSRDDVRDWPLMGFVIKEMNTIFVNRERRMDASRVAGEITRALEQGYSVHLFAEGGVSTYGELRPFKPALLEPAISLDLPVHYVTIHYETGKGDPPPSKSVLWPEDLSFGAYAVRLLQLRRIYVTLTFGDMPVKGIDRKELAGMLYGKVRDDLRPLH